MRTIQLLTSFMWNGQLRLLPRWLKEGRGWCVFHLRWEKLWDDPTCICAVVLAVGWKQYSHTQPLPSCHRSVSTDTQQGQKGPDIKEMAKWLNKNLFSLETPHIRKDKETDELHHEDLEMETLELIALWLQRTLQIWTENSCDILARTLALRLEYLHWITEDIQWCPDWTNQGASAFLLTGLAWWSEDVCMKVLHQFLRVMQGWEVIFISVVIFITWKQREPSSGSWMQGCVLHMLTLSLIHCTTWRNCSDFF